MASPVNSISGNAGELKISHADKYGARQMSEPHSAFIKLRMTRPELVGWLNEAPLGLDRPEPTGWRTPHNAAVAAPACSVNVRHMADKTNPSPAGSAGLSPNNGRAARWNQPDFRQVEMSGWLGNDRPVCRYRRAYFAAHDSPDRAVVVEGPPLATKLSTKARKPRAQQCAHAYRSSAIVRNRPKSEAGSHHPHSTRSGNGSWPVPNGQSPLFSPS
jgi:hypothetical protein